MICPIIRRNGLKTADQRSDSQNLIIIAPLTLHRLDAIQGLLFTAFGFAWEKGRPLVYVLAVIGIFVALFSAIGLSCSHEALTPMKNWWEQEQDLSYSGPGVVGYWHDDSLTIKWLGPWRSLPIVFFMGWCVILLINFYATR